jgi:hypothetical protein
VEDRRVQMLEGKEVGIFHIGGRRRRRKNDSSVGSDCRQAFSYVMTWALIVR